MREWAMIFCLALLYAASAGSQGTLESPHPSSFRHRHEAAHRTSVMLEREHREAQDAHLAEATSIFHSLRLTRTYYHGLTDILATKLSPEEKSKAVNAFTAEYLGRHEALSPAPIEVTLRRSAVLLKPYYMLYRSLRLSPQSPETKTIWWLRTVLETLASEGDQEHGIEKTLHVFRSQLRRNPPPRVYLGREIMPRLTREFPAAAHILDNFQVLHSIVHDILEYPNWSESEKRTEVERVAEAFRRQSGDESLVRSYWTERDKADPSSYLEWTRSLTAEIHQEMLEELLPHLGVFDFETRRALFRHLRLKLRSGLQEGEFQGSLLDSFLRVDPEIRLVPAARAPGATPRFLVAIMLKSWYEKQARSD